MAVLLLALFHWTVQAKEEKSPTVNWPVDKPVLQFSIGKYLKTGSYQNRNVFNIDVMVKNVSTTHISNATFHLYLLDAKKMRVADHWITVSNVDPNATVKSVVTTQTVGVPVEFSVVADHLPQELSYLEGPAPIALTIVSLPPGAKADVDGRPAGATPLTVALPPGEHNVALEKDGFVSGTMPFTVAADQNPGKTYTFELLGAGQDNLELRDGSMVFGIVVSLDANEVVIKTAQGEQRYSRSLVKRVSLVERAGPVPAAN